MTFDEWYDEPASRIVVGDSVVARGIARAAYEAGARSAGAKAKSELGQDADSIILLERGQALAEALEIEMDGGGGRSAKSREAIAAWCAETRKEGKP